MTMASSWARQQEQKRKKTHPQCQDLWVVPVPFRCCQSLPPAFWAPIKQATAPFFFKENPEKNFYPKNQLIWHQVTECMVGKYERRKNKSSGRLAAHTERGDGQKPSIFFSFKNIFTSATYNLNSDRQMWERRNEHKAGKNLITSAGSKHWVNIQALYKSSEI